MSRPLEIDFYCPSCAAPASTGIAHCRRCGAYVRSVPGAMYGRLTLRQRSFVSALATTSSYVLTLASISVSAVSPRSSSITIFLGIYSVVALAGFVARIGYLLAHDTSSGDSIFGRRRPAAGLQLSDAPDDGASTSRM